MKNNIKKTSIIFIALFICFTLTACKEEQEQVPLVPYETLEEINKLATVHLVKPEGVTPNEEKFNLRENNTAEYVYIANGYKYYMRGCKDITSDMCDIVANGKSLFADNINDTIAYKESTKNGYKVYRFILGGKQYIFGVFDEGKLSGDLFAQEFEEVYKQIIHEGSSNEFKNAEGKYFDKTSQRATLHLQLTDINKAAIDIVWGNSADSYEEWIIEASYGGFNLTYKKDNYIHFTVTKNQDGTVLKDEIEDMKIDEGYFEFDGENIMWTGSGNEQTSSCVFEKIPE